MLFRSSEDEYRTIPIIQEEIRKKFALPVFLLSNSVDINKLVTTIIDRFSE